MLNLNKKMESQNQKKNSGLIISIVGFIVALLVVGSIWLSTQSGSTATNTVAVLPTTTSQNTIPAQSDTSSAVAAGSSGDAKINSVTSPYANGSYSASSSYGTPHNGSESIDVTLTVQNGIITDASISQSGYDRESQQYQSRFASGYKSYVVGKSLSSLSLSRVSGASLTTGGFNSAVATIKTEA